MRAMKVNVVHVHLINVVPVDGVVSVVDIILRGCRPGQMPVSHARARHERSPPADRDRRINKGDGGLLNFGVRVPAFAGVITVTLRVAP